MTQHQPPQPSARPTATDSPWFWVCLFCGFGLTMLVVMSPKYAARQQQIERKYHMQEYIYYGQAAADRIAARVAQRAESPGKGPTTPAPLAPNDGNPNEPLRFEQPLIITLRPLLATFAGMFFVGLIALWAKARRQLHDGVSTP